MRFDVSVRKRFPDAEVAASFASDAALTVLFGPSGAGKSSVLNMIAGLVRPDDGWVRVDGATLFDAATDVPAEARRIGYVFQEPRLFPHMRVRDNLLYGRPHDRRLGDEIDFLGIGHLLDRWPATLSGGEAKRVAIGRALLRDPAVLLLDEPLASLDRARREEVMQVIERLRDEVRLPTLLVTHDHAEAERLGGRIVEIG